MIAVFSTDRAWRLALDAALRARGHPVRIAGRPAELAKCLGDGVVRLVVAGPEGRDAEAAVPVVGDGRLLCVTPGETIAQIVHRAEEQVGTP